MQPSSLTSRQNILQLVNNRRLSQRTHLANRIYYFLRFYCAWKSLWATRIKANHVWSQPCLLYCITMIISNNVLEDIEPITYICIAVTMFVSLPSLGEFGTLIFGRLFFFFSFFLFKDCSYLQGIWFLDILTFVALGNHGNTQIFYRSRREWHDIVTLFHH